MKRRGFIKKSLLTTAGATLTASSLSTPAISKNTQRWSMTTAWPKNFPGLGTGANKLAEMINQASNGRLEIKVYGAGEIVPAFEAIDAVANGTVEMGHGAPYYWKGKVHAAQFLACIPFGFTVHEQNAWLDFAGGQEIADEIYAQMNCKFFSCGTTGVQMGGWYNNEIKTLADYKSLKMRMPGLGGEVIKAAGATVVNLSGGDLLTAMKTGAIDATEWNGPYNDLAFGLHDVAKHYYFPGWHEPSVIIDSFINLDAWNTLDNDLKSIIQTSCKAASQFMHNEYTARNAQSLIKLKNKYGITPQPFSSDLLTALKTLSDEVISDLAHSNPLSKKTYESIIKFKKEVGQWSHISEHAYLNARA